MALFAVVIFPSDERGDLIQTLHDLVSPDSPCQIIAETLYLLESDKGAPDIAQALGQGDPTDSDLPFHIEKLNEGVQMEMMKMLGGAP